MGGKPGGVVRRSGCGRVDHARPNGLERVERMSPRTTILRELERIRRSGNDDYTRPGDLSGFERQPAKYQAAVNALLQERLINGRKDEGGRLAIAINDDRLPDVRKAIRPLYARPVAWLALITILAIGAAGLLVM